jgi:protease stability complex PrcB-like protein
MNRKIFIIGMLSIVVVAVLASQRSLRSKSSPNKRRNETLSPFNQATNLEKHSGIQNTEKAPSQPQEVSFSRLKVPVAEKQARGQAKEEDAIPAQERVFVDSESWHAFWAKYDAGQAPQVDFKSRHVAAVFLSTKPSPGYGVEINRITYDPREKRTVIHVIELLPNPDRVYGGIIVYPADVVIFDTRLGEVQFSHIKKVSDE